MGVSDDADGLGSFVICDGGSNSGVGESNEEDSSSTEANEGVSSVVSILGSGASVISSRISSKGASDSAVG